jgi:hypothetical protein
VNLHRKLPRGRNDQDPRLIRSAFRGRGMGDQPLQGGDEKRCGLSGSSLGLPGHISSGKRKREGLRLNGRTMAESGV